MPGQVLAYGLRVKQLTTAYPQTDAREKISSQRVLLAGA